MNKKVEIGEIEISGIEDIPGDNPPKWYRFVFHIEWREDGCDERAAVEKAFETIFNPNYRGLLRSAIGVQRLGEDK